MMLPDDEIKTLPLNWLYPYGRKGYIVWSCTSGLLVQDNKVVGPPPIVKALDRLAEDVKKGI